ncbi:hypothetical protein [Streptomyces sp. NPDC048436]
MPELRHFHLLVGGDGDVLGRVNQREVEGRAEVRYRLATAAG